MTTIVQTERDTQNRVLKLFQEQLGYAYLGNWEERGDNRNIEEELLRVFLKQCKVSEALFPKVLHELNKAAGNQSRSLYEVNKEVYGLLRYGVTVKKEAGEKNVTVALIDWKHPHKNHFAVAEEVTISGQNTKRPDIVLYVNGIALGVLEIKRATVTVSEGIRQNLDNQKSLFIERFFATMQFVMAGNDSEGLRYGTIETREKYYLAWKEPSEIANPLDRALVQLCAKERFLELLHDFVVFDSGTKNFAAPINISV